MATRRLLALLLVGLALVSAAERRCGADGVAPATCGAPEVPLSQQPSTVSTDDLWTVAQRLRQLREVDHVDPACVLVVFDIDNTLLAMEGLLGSDPWFNQEVACLSPAAGVPTAVPPPKYAGAFVDDRLEPRPVAPVGRCAASSISDLVEIQDALFTLRSMRRTQSDADVVVRSLQARYACLALTSRGPETRAATLRALGQNSISFTGSAPAVGDPMSRGEFSWDEASVKAVMSDYELKLGGGEGKIAGKRELLADGVLMTSGANKGFALRMFCAHLKEAARFRHVVFVDDTAKHHRAVRDAFACRPEFSVETFWYTREHPRARLFFESSGAITEVADELDRVRSPGAGAFCGAVGR